MHLVRHMAAGAGVQRGVVLGQALADVVMRSESPPRWRPSALGAHHADDIQLMGKRLVSANGAALAAALLLSVWRFGRSWPVACHADRADLSAAVRDAEGPECSGGRTSPPNRLACGHADQGVHLAVHATLAAVAVTIWPAPDLSLNTPCVLGRVIITQARFWLCCSHFGLQVGHVHVAVLVALGHHHLHAHTHLRAGRVGAALLGIRADVAVCGGPWPRGRP